MSKLPRWRTERAKALTNLDIAWGRRQIEGNGYTCSDDEAVLISLHKTRYEVKDVPEELRHASGDWLRERGYGRRVGPLLPKGELP